MDGSGEVRGSLITSRTTSLTNGHIPTRSERLVLSAERVDF